MQNIKQSSMMDFQTLEKLGEGAFGVVFKVKRKQDGLLYAMKKVKLVSMKQKQRENAVNQIRILASLKCDMIISYKDAFYDQVSSNLCVVMQFASQGDLLKKISNYSKNRTKFPQEEIWKALVHMTKGLKSLHDVKILHRDLKCANVFINADGIYKLGDLNVSKVLKKQMAYTQTGTPYYASPQVWQDQPYNAKSDIWSLGCVIYEMAALKPPFQALDLQGLCRKVKAGVYDKIPSNYSADLGAIISMLLKVNPKLRPTAEQILNNSIVQKHYKQNIGSQNEQQKQQLLQTIVFNQRNLKALKDKLPKSNYNKQQEKKQEKDQKKVEKVPVKLEITNQNKNNNNIKSENKSRDRVLSVGAQIPSYCQSPRIVTHKKDQVKRLQDASKKLVQLNKLPPRPKNHEQPQPYKLPPRPQPLQPIVQTPKNISNKQVINPDNKIQQSRVKLKSIPSSENLRKQLEQQSKNNAGGIFNSRDKSKQNVNVIEQPKYLPRSNSVQRIQPLWWG